MKPAPRPGWFRALLLIAIMATVVWLSSKHLLVPLADYRWQLPAGYWLNAMSSDGTRVLTSPRGNSFRAIRDVDRDISINDAVTGSVIERVDIPVIKDEIFHLQFSPDTRFVILAQETQQLLYHIETKQYFRFDSFPRNADGTFHMIYDRLTCWSPDNKQVVIKTPKELVLWDTQRLQTIAKLSVKSVLTIFERFPELWFSPQCTSLVTVDRDSLFTIWDTVTGAKRAALAIPTLMKWKGHSTYDPACRFLDDQTALIHLATRQPLQRKWQDHFFLVDMQKGDVLDKLSIDGTMQNTGSITDEEKPADIYIMESRHSIWLRINRADASDQPPQRYQIDKNRFAKQQSAHHQLPADENGSASNSGRYLHHSSFHAGKFHNLFDWNTGQSMQLTTVSNSDHLSAFSKSDQWFKIKDRYIYDEPLWNRLVESIKFIRLSRMSTTHHKLDLWSLPAQQHLISLILPEGSHEFLNETGTRLVVQQGNAVQVYDLPARDGRWWFIGLCTIAAICSIYMIVSCFRRSSNPAPVNDTPPSPSHQV